MKNTITTLIIGLGMLMACSSPTDTKQELDDSMSNTCLIDFVDPQDGEGSSEKEIQEFINESGLSLTPAGIYSQSNHLYKIDGRCPTKLDSDLVENIEQSMTYRVPMGTFVKAESGDFASQRVNDPLFQHQWNFRHIDAEKAWETSHSGEGVIVAVIDTGVAYKEHSKVHALEDMNETKFTKGVSFTRRGLPDGLDDHAHGSHVAGTIAQSTNNGVGVAGIAPAATIMPLKVLGADGSGSTEDIADAIRYAADNDANVINMSLGGAYPSDIMRDAVDYAHEKGVVVICAAGNESSSHVGYPAGYDNCLSIGSTDKHYEKSWFSNFGKDVDFSAPGGDTRGHVYDGILQNTINPRNIKEQGYYGFQGTSMAAPHAAGVAALIFGEGVSDNEEVIRILLESTSQPDNWDSAQMGTGITNAADAVAMAKKSSGGDGDKDGGWTMPHYKWLLIGGGLGLLFFFVGYKMYRALKDVETEDYDSTDLD